MRAWWRKTWKEFVEFAARGSAMEMAVGLMLAAALGKVVTSLVNDILMPPIGKLVSEVDFSNLYINLSGTHYTSLADAKKAGAVTLNYGTFLNELVNFLIVAAVVFVVVKQVNRLRRR